MIAALVEELQDSKDLVAARRASSETAAIGLALRLKTAMIQKINNIPHITTKDAKRLMSVVAESGFDEAGRNDILDAIEARLGEQSAQAMVTEPQQEHSKLGQDLLWPTRYLTQSDWDKLEDPTRPITRKIHDLRMRIADGLECCMCSEETWRWMMACLVLSHFRTWPTYKSIYDCLQDLKECFQVSRAQPQQRQFARLWVYPEQPADLAKERFAKAYPDANDPPVNHPIERLDQVGLHHIPLRSNSKLLKDELKSRTGQSSRAGSLEAGQPGMATEIVKAMMALCPQFADQAQRKRLGDRGRGSGDALEGGGAILELCAPKADQRIEPPTGDDCPRPGRLPLALLDRTRTTLSSCSGDERPEHASPEEPSDAVAPTPTPKRIAATRPEFSVAPSDDKGGVGGIDTTSDAPKLTPADYEKRALDALAKGREARAAERAASKAIETAGVAKRPAAKGADDSVEPAKKTAKKSPKALAYNKAYDKVMDKACKAANDKGVAFEGKLKDKARDAARAAGKAASAKV